MAVLLSESVDCLRVLRMCKETILSILELIGLAEGELVVGLFGHGVFEDRFFSEIFKEIVGKFL